MTDRLEKIFSLLTPCETFADVGCDHGYMALAAVERGLCKKVYISDVSAPSLEKAKKLLTERFPGRFESFLCDGLSSVPYAEEVLIAGMGGEEIIKILQKSPYKPIIAVLQPMKNAEKVRRFVRENGYGITRDFMFYAEDKYYEVIRIELGKTDFYTEQEILFGKENLQGNKDFQKYLNAKIVEIKGILAQGDLKDESRAELTKKLTQLSGVLL